MSVNSFATSVNIVVHADHTNTQNARIHYDTDDTKGWVVDPITGTLSGGTELRRSALDPVDKTLPGDALDSDVGVEFTYIAAQGRSVKRLKAGTDKTAARMVFSPAHL